MGRTCKIKQKGSSAMCHPVVIQTSGEFLDYILYYFMEFN